MEIKDTLKVNFKNRQLKGNLTAFFGKDGDFWVGIVPSLNVSTYSDNLEDAQEALKDAIDIFVNDLFALSESQFYEELKAMGFEQHQFFKKKYSNSYVDENGVLQNFDNPETVQKQQLSYA